ncbi:MOSC domain-containing protein [Calidifontimicrobium sp. SYSU G02091]|uniref:MOSC domain-containing protein n=1 Tax=Calidifontimicrobium sp. SYSU G02091 TaxID=2926421 RepID=UPI001F53B8E5|nr:MOSC domain-containing protein [Calidifontimicrobium sp. SYSU G02091]MCI1191660.1 MOSC domain-containing protein [Calidifontimicrobium sp. SYSU G02091]
MSHGTHRYVVSINVAAARVIEVSGRRVASAIGKRPVGAPVAVHALGLDGDEQADLTVHGGLAKAVYVYPVEHYPVWRTLRAQARVALWDEPLPPGAFGENLTLAGLLEADAFVGDRLCFEGGVELAVSEPRHPCAKFDAAMGFRYASKMMAQSGQCGFYLQVVVPGTLEAGERFVVRPGERAVSIAELFRARVRPGRY